MPIWEMIQRGWIREVFALDEATSEMMRFFGFKTPSDWNEEFPDLPLPVILSPDEDAEIQLRIQERQKAGLRYAGTPKEEWSKYPSLPLLPNPATQATGTASGQQP